ncbi:hypothetical protein B9Z55_016377 [Caenorhabditis nigoni]|uniref:7TM GPCR serpentine receptor class x (Srx) domain-containing protein n=1 Tax=Caenorhabditis nigoni TaxID=1611254 RepID=A0A2G5T4A0_9PELO|nr:hypothetical protein B9Z55_016377 [Caenorhabditis nigoni]
MQDALHVIDMLNYTLFYRLVDSHWLQFILMSLSLALIYVIDGIVMLHFHVYTYRKIVQRKKNICFVSAVQFSPRRP